MLCYIDLEHESVLEDPRRGDAHLARLMGEKLRFEKLSGAPCLILRYPRVAQGWVERMQPRVILISGAHSDWSLYEDGAFQALLALIRNWSGPQIGFCAGHQLIAHAFGAAIGPIRPLRPDETDLAVAELGPDFGGGFLKELGIQDVHVIHRDPIFDGLPDAVQMREDHYWEVKELPAEFLWLARTDTSPVQAFRHHGRPLYGTQFHPERYDEEHPHGRELLRNFFKLAFS